MEIIDFYHQKKYTCFEYVLKDEFNFQMKE